MPKTFPTSQRKKWLTQLQQSAASASHGVKTSPSLRIVVDTNVWYSAIVYDGRPEQLVFYCLANCSVIASEDLLNEITSRLKTKANLPYRLRRLLRRYISEICEVISIETGIVDVEARDPNDTHILAAAIEGGCHFIITGDRDLLELEEYKGIVITTPAYFLKIAGVNETQT